MDLDNRVINAILHIPKHKVFHFLNFEKLTPQLFNTHQSEFKFLRRYIAKHGQCPSKALFKRRYPSFSVKKVIDPLQELVGEMLRRAQQNTFAKFINDIDPEDVTENLETYISGVSKLAVDLNKYDQTSEDHEYTNSFNSRFQTYEDRKNNLDAVTFSTGIDKMDEFLGGGFIPPQLVVLAGDPKMGKTWWLINTLIKNYERGKVPLLITPEMDNEEIAFRIDASRFELPHDLLRFGKLTKRQEARWKHRASKDTQPLHIVDATQDSDFTPSKVEAKIDLYKPDFVIIDSAYYLRADGADPRREESYLDRQRLVKQLKGLCKRKNIPILCIVQMKADTEKTGEKGEAALRGIYGGDHWAQGADIVMRLRGSRAEKYRRLVLLANREGATFQECLIKYNFEPFPKIEGIDGDDEDEEIDAEDNEDVVEVEI